MRKCRGFAKSKLIVRDSFTGSTLLVSSAQVAGGPRWKNSHGLCERRRNDADKFLLERIRPKHWVAQANALS